MFQLTLRTDGPEATLRRDGVEATLSRRGVKARRVPFGLDWAHDVDRVLRGEMGVALDVGANTGQTARQILRRFSNARVISFEPNPVALAHLRAFAGRRSGLEVVAAAVSSRNGTDTLVLTTDTEHSTLSRSPQSGETSTDVPTIALDDFCAERGVETVSLLKVDTEGHEIPVLQGAGRLLSEHRVQTLLVECDFGVSPQLHTDFSSIHRLLAGHGYSVVTFYTHGVTEKGWSWGDVLYRLPG